MSTRLLTGLALALYGCTVQVPPAVPAAGIAPLTAPSAAQILADPQARVRAFIQTRASLDPEQETVIYWTGSITELLPGETRPSSAPLLYFDGYNVARTTTREDGGPRLLTRELMVYRNAQGDIIDCWRDPRAPADAPGRPVWHVRNDPVNFDMGAPPHRLFGDHVVWSFRLPRAYPSPLTVAEHPAQAASDTYQSIELFDFEVESADLIDPTLDSIPTRVIWSRVGQWLPWMHRGQQPGWLVYHATGHKLPNGWQDLPASLRTWVDEHAPEFQHAPTADTHPNQTSWKAYKQANTRGEISATCPQP